MRPVETREASRERVVFTSFSHNESAPSLTVVGFIRTLRPFCAFREISRPPRHSAARGARAASAAVGAGAMFGFTKKKKDGSVKGGSVRSGSDRGTTRSSAKSLTKSATRKDGAKARGAQPGLEDDDYG